LGDRRAALVRCDRCLVKSKQADQEVDVLKRSTCKQSESRVGTGRFALIAAVVAVLLLSALTVAGCTTSTKTTTKGTTGTAKTTQAPADKTPAGQQAPSGMHDVTKLEIKDLRTGTGQAAKLGDSVSVNYTGWLTNGTMFDTSVGKQSFTFQLGAQQVIPGWDQGVVGMKVGGKRTLTIPPDLGYGNNGAGNGVIPPNATLVFNVELLSIGQ
jgi:FKBP-type peptidyl-prolyl cis-trans isomerase FkpA